MSTTSTTRVRPVRVSGPLVPFVTGLTAALSAAGYSPGSATTQLLLLNHLSCWLAAQGLGVQDLTDERIEAFFAARRAEGRPWLLTRQSLLPLLDHLAACGVRPSPTPPAPVRSPQDEILARFQQYLLHERAIASSTAAAYMLRVRRFLAGLPAQTDLATVTAADVTRGILAEASVVSVGASQVFVAALRAFLRFAFLEGLVPADLTAAALAITGRRRSFLPRGLSDRDVASLLRTCDRTLPAGRRDAAILLLLVRLGLRASEVAALQLQDVEWRVGELVVHGKSRQLSRLPLPADVGAAIAAWLRHGRPLTSHRDLFVSTQAPISPIGRGAISEVVRRACQHAGLAEVGAHRLRHTAACALLRAGVPLSQIGQVLRHRSLTSTAIYARVDVDHLRQLAQPWPGGAAR